MIQEESPGQAWAERGAHDHTALGFNVSTPNTGVSWFQR
jgi:hypothetical protein